MTRTQLLHEIRRMRCEEAYGGWRERRLTQEEAARLLGAVIRLGVEGDRNPCLHPDA